MLWLGREGQDTYGRKNFLDLISVFTAPPLFTVLHGRRELGFVDESTFLASATDGPPVLLLAGRAWRVAPPRLEAAAGATSSRPRTRAGRAGGARASSSRELCGAIRGVLAAEESPRMLVARGRGRGSRRSAPGSPGSARTTRTSWSRPRTRSPGGRSPAAGPTRPCRRS